MTALAQRNRDITADPPGEAKIAVDRAAFQHLQALEDAIDYRTARLAARCADCQDDTADGRCDDHAVDLVLIEAYQRAAEELDETMTAERQRERAAAAAASRSG